MSDADDKEVDSFPIDNGYFCPMCGSHTVKTEGGEGDYYKGVLSKCFDCGSKFHIC